MYDNFKLTQFVACGMTCTRLLIQSTQVGIDRAWCFGWLLAGVTQGLLGSLRSAAEGMASLYVSGDFIIAFLQISYAACRCSLGPHILVVPFYV